jgi:hypothetical protein
VIAPDRPRPKSWRTSGSIARASVSLIADIQSPDSRSRSPSCRRRRRAAHAATDRRGAVHRLDVRTNARARGRWCG